MPVKQSSDRVTDDEVAVDRDEPEAGGVVQLGGMSLPMLVSRRASSAENQRMAGLRMAQREPGKSGCRAMTKILHHRIAEIDQVVEAGDNDCGCPMNLSPPNCSVKMSPYEKEGDIERERAETVASTEWRREW